MFNDAHLEAVAGGAVARVDEPANLLARVYPTAHVPLPNVHVRLGGPKDNLVEGDVEVRQGFEGRRPDLGQCRPTTAP